MSKRTRTIVAVCAGLVIDCPVGQPAGTGSGAAGARRRIRSGPGTEGRAGHLRPIRAGQELAEADVG